MNKFAAINLNKRINAKCDAEGLTGIDREIFQFVATGEYGINSIIRRFSDSVPEMLAGMERLMDRGLLHIMHSADRYYTSAV